MAKEWFCKISGKQFGPFTAEEVRKLATQGKLKPDHHVKQGTEGLWIKAEALADLFSENDSPWSATEPLPAATEPPRRTQPPLPEARRRDAEAAKTPKTGLPPKQERASHTQSVDEDPLAAIAASELVIPHIGEHGAGRRHHKKADSSLLFVIVPVSVFVLIVAGIFIVTTWNRAPEDTVKPLAEMLREKSQEPKTADTDPAFASSKDGAGSTTASASSSPENSSEPRPEDGKWYDTSKEAAWCGGATVKLLSAEVASPKVISASGKEVYAKEAMLLLTLEVRNNSKDHELEYNSWSVGGPTMNTVKLVDNRSRPYVPKFKSAFPGYMLDKQLTQATIDADAAIEDVLAFQSPRIDASLKYLRLQLPAGAFGEKGYVRLEIPVSMIVVQGKETQSPAGEPAGPGTPSRPPKGNPKSDFGIEGGIEGPTDAPSPSDGANPVPPRPETAPWQPNAEAGPGPAGADAGGAEQTGTAIGGIDELKVDDSDLIRKKAEREVHEKAAAAEEAKKGPKKKKPSTNPAEELFKKY